MMLCRRHGSFNPFLVARQLYRGQITSDHQPSIDATFQHRLVAADAVVAQDGEVDAFVPG